MQAILPLPVVLPLGAAFAILAMAHVAALKRLTTLTALAAVAVNLVLSFLLLAAPDGRLFVGGWGAGKTLGIEMVSDGLSKLMVLTVNMVALAALLFAASYMRHFRAEGLPAGADRKLWLFECLFLLMTGAMNGVVLTGDLFNMFVFLEVAAIASYALVGFGCEADELEAAFKYLVLGSVGSAFILLGITILYALTGQLNMAQVASLLPKVGATGPAVLLAAACLLGGLALKAAMVPFHAWLPDAHPSAPAPISAMLSGVLIKACGVYTLGRVLFNVLGPSVEYGGVLAAMGAVSMLAGVLLAVGQWDFKRLLAYHSISQMGYVVLAFGAAAVVVSQGGSRTVASLLLFGGLFHMFNHAVFKGLLFLSSGAIEQQAGTRMLKELGGLARRMPVTSFCCRVGALSIAGVPPFNGFFSKLIIIIALAAAKLYLLAALAALVALVTLLSFVKVQRYALDGEPEGKAAGAREAPALMCVAMGALALICATAGVGAAFLYPRLFAPAADALLAGARALAAGGAP